MAKPLSDKPVQDVTSLLVDWSNGDEGALEKLTPLVYDELHRLAQGYIRRERSGHTLQATALVNEAFVRLVDQRRVEWQSSVHFVALAAQMMRRILVDHARSHRVQKRGGGAQRVSLDQVAEIAVDGSPDLVELDEALDRLAEVNPEWSRVVELRFFGGLTSEQIAKMLEVSVPTVTRRWRLAKAWLYRFMTGDAPDAA